MKSNTVTKTIAIWKKMTLTGLATLALAGFSCQSQAGFMDNLMGNLLGINSPARRLELYGQVTDKQLVGAFYQLSTDGKTETIPEDITKAGWKFSGINGVMISFEKHISDSANMQGAANSLGRYISNADSDEIAQKYIAAATERGNTVRIYQPKLSELFAQGFRVLGIVPGPDRQTFTGYDRVLIEYDNTGRVVSFVNRVMQGVTIIGVQLSQYTAIYSGELSIRHLEDSISQHEIEHYFIREIRPSVSNQPTPQPQEDRFNRTYEDGNGASVSGVTNQTF